MIRFSNMLWVILAIFGQQTAWTLGATAIMEQYCKTYNLLCFVDANGEIIEVVTSIGTNSPLSSASGQLLTQGAATSSWLTSPKCPEGYSAVFRSSGQPACAKEIIEPQ